MQMRGIIYIIIIISLFVSACGRMGEDIGAGNEGTIEYKISCDALTKGGIGNGDNINYVWYAVYQRKIDGAYDLVSTYEPVPFAGGEAVCRVTLARDLSYKIVFVAQHYDDDGPVYFVDDRNNIIVMPSDPVANSEDFDLFHFVDTIDDYDGAMLKRAELGRVVAQVNLLCSQSNWDEVHAAGKAPLYSSMSIAGVPEYFNLLDGTVGGDKTVEYRKSEIAEDMRLAYAYCLADGDADMTVKLYGNANDQECISEFTSRDLPVEANKKTNVNCTLTF